jgi:hypothetical protein
VLVVIERRDEVADPLFGTAAPVTGHDVQHAQTAR